MKLLSLLLFLTSMHLSATTFSQTVTLKVKKQPLSQVLTSIKQQTGYHIIYNDRYVNPNLLVSVQAYDQPLEEVLNKLLTPQSLTYYIKDNTIAIRPLDSNELSLGVEDNGSQQKMISGRVTNEKGEPLEGVSIRVKESTLTTLTDLKGTFRMALPSNRDTLLFSMVGFETFKLKVLDEIDINVVLRVAVNDIEEVVVVGYGSLLKSELAGSVAGVDMDDLVKAPVASIDDALGGRVAGVSVQSPDGTPGSNANIVIRGNNSLTQDNTPLYVIDGFPVENFPLNSLNMTDIESINVLKDASLTSIYGSRGANGVVVITTKQGKIGDPEVKLDAYWGGNRNAKKIKVMDAYDFVKFQLDLSENSGNQNAHRQYTNADPLLTFPHYDPNGRVLDDYKAIAGYNWQDLIFRDGLQQSYNLAVSGGQQKTKYFLGGNIFSQDGIILGSGFKRYQGRISLNQEINRKMNLSVSLNYTHADKSGRSPTDAGGGSTANILASAWGYRPVTGVNLPDESLIESGQDPEVVGDERFNPYLTVRNEFILLQENHLLANGALSYKLTNHLQLRVSGSINTQNNKGSYFYNSNTPSGRPTGLTGPNGTLNQTDIRVYSNENTLTYNPTFDKIHSLNLVSGYSLQGVKFSGFGYRSTFVPNEILGVSGLDEGVPTTLSSSSSNSVLMSYFTRGNYTLDGKYIFSLSMRMDGSSKFHRDNRWGYFPAGGFAWNFHKEKFMEDLSFVSEGKFRLSYGLNGNNRIGSFDYLPALTLPISVSYPFGNSYSKGAIVNSLGNSSLKWESTAQVDAGVDVSFLKKRLSLTVDYYHKTTSDLLLQALLPVSTGFTNAFKNIGKVSNKGWEISIASMNVQRQHFAWETAFNVSFNRNKVLELTENQEALVSTLNWDINSASIFPYIAKIGRPMALFYGYKWVGNYQYDDFDLLPDGNYILKSTVPDNGSGRLPGAGVQPGSIKFADLNGDGIINAMDRTVIGNPQPIFIGGLSNNFTYKGIDLNVFLQWSYGNDIQNANRMVFEGATAQGSSALINLNQYDTYKNRWTPENQNNTYFRAGGGQYTYSSRTIEDGSFLRLKTVTLGYKLSSRTQEAFHIKRARVYVSAQNLLTITNYSGNDPEVSIKASNLTPGFDYSAYPRSRTIVLGLDVSF